jgi:DNA-binding transcriptional regulator YdaS (Cro superfamily)
MVARPSFSSTGQMMRASAARHRAVAAAGGAARLAQHLGLHVATVTGWTFCPAQHIDAVAAASGVLRHELRPDLYPRLIATTRELSADEAVAAHLMAGEHFARTGRCLSAEEAR